MTLVQVLIFYIFWHYTKAWRDIFRIINNYLWFISNYFSIGVLFRTLFSPWRRLTASGAGGKKDSFLGLLLVNTFMRLVGFLIRTVTIIAGSFSVLFVLLISLVFLVIWFFLPVIIFFLFFGGIGQILKVIFGF